MWRHSLPRSLNPEPRLQESCRIYQCSNEASFGGHLSSGAAFQRRKGLQDKVCWVRGSESPLLRLVGPETTPNLHDAPNGPYVHLETVPFLAQHLRSYVIRSPAQGLLPFPVILHFGCQSKIPWDRGRKREAQTPASVVCQCRQLAQM